MTETVLSGRHIRIAIQYQVWRQWDLRIVMLQSACYSENKLKVNNNVNQKVEHGGMYLQLDVDSHDTLLEKTIFCRFNKRIIRNI